MEDTFGAPVVFGRPRRPVKARGFWRAAEQHLWCPKCMRSFPNGVHRTVGGRELCPYQDCDGPAADAVDWSTVLLQRPNYPAAPWMAVRYPYDRPSSARAPAAGVSP